MVILEIFGSLHTVFNNVSIQDLVIPNVVNACVAIGSIFLTITMIRNVFVGMTVESDMSINVKNIGTGVVMCLAIALYKDLAKIFCEMMFIITDSFTWENLTNTQGIDQTQLVAAMEKTIDSSLPMIVNTVVNFIGKMIRPFIEAFQMVIFGILYITGPIAMAFAILFDYSIFKKWLNALIVVMMWSLTMNLIEGISTAVIVGGAVAQGQQISDAAIQAAQGGFIDYLAASFTTLGSAATEATYSGMFVFVSQLMYFFVPMITSKYLNISTVSGSMGKMTSFAMMGVGMMSKGVTMGTSAVAGKVAGGASSAVKNSVDQSISKQGK